MVLDSAIRISSLERRILRHFGTLLPHHVKFLGMSGGFRYPRIARLTPPADVLASFDLAIVPVAPREGAAEQAWASRSPPTGHEIGPSAQRAALARRHALRSEEPSTPALCARRTVQQAYPASTPASRCPKAADAVATIDAVQVRRRHGRKRFRPWPQDERVLPLAGHRRGAGLKLRLGGAALRRIDAALRLRALGVERVTPVRQPRGPRGLRECRCCHRAAPRR